MGVTTWCMMHEAHHRYRRELNTHTRGLARREKGWLGWVGCVVETRTKVTRSEEEGYLCQRGVQARGITCETRIRLSRGSSTRKGRGGGSNKEAQLIVSATVPRLQAKQAQASLLGAQKEPGMR